MVESDSEVNPYESPEAAFDADRAYAVEVPLKASFMVTQKLFRRAIWSYSMQSPWLAISAACALIVGLLLLTIFQWLFPESSITAHVGVELSIWLALVWSVLAYIVRRRTRRTVEAHQVLAIDVLRHVEIGSDSVTVKSGGSSQTWPLQGILNRGSKSDYLVLELRRHLILVIPANAEVDPHPFKYFRRAVGRRLRKFTWSNFFVIR